MSIVITATADLFSPDQIAIAVELGCITILAAIRGKIIVPIAVDVNVAIKITPHQDIAAAVCGYALSSVITATADLFSPFKLQVEGIGVAGHRFYLQCQRGFGLSRPHLQLPVPPFNCRPSQRLRSRYLSPRQPMQLMNKLFPPIPGSDVTTIEHKVVQLPLLQLGLIAFESI